MAKCKDYSVNISTFSSVIVEEEPVKKVGEQRRFGGLFSEAFFKPLMPSAYS